MEVRVLLFGPAATTFGRGEVWVRVREGATCREILEAVSGVAPQLADHVRDGRLAINHQFADAGRVVKCGDEVALIAMVSGG